ncbi:phage portal protein [Methylobacterium sp. MA0201]|uniref:phage portal protein n=1 Tax=Methylobacterium alsaeris TaxID=3344826 RepID=UPI0037580CAF
MTAPKNGGGRTARAVHSPSSPVAQNAGRQHTPLGKRAMLMNGGGGRSVEAAYQAASSSALIPFVPDIGPIDAVVYQRRLMWLARHLYRNDPWIKALVDTWTSYVVGTGPVPRSRHNRLADLFMASSARFDSRGVSGWGKLLREDIVKNKFIDGEVFATFAFDEDDDDGLLVPTRITTLTSDYCPPELIRSENEGRSFTVAGVQYRVGPDGRRTDRREGFWFYPVHPRDVYANPGIHWMPEFTPAGEAVHFFKGPTGSPRGEVPIAAAIVRALKLATYEDAELRRKITATFMSLFIERPLDAMDDERLFPTADEISDLLDQIQMQPAGIWQLPAGYKANVQTPADSPTNLIASIRWHLFAICSSVRVPVHLVTGNHDGISDRTERLAGLDFKRTIEVERQDLEDQGVDECWRQFVDHSLATGAFEMPRNTPAWDVYQVDWDWPIIQLNNLSTDINAFAQGIAAGIIDPSYATQNLFGVRHEVVTRRLAEAEARRQAVGFEPLAAPGTPAAPAPASGRSAPPAASGGAGTTAPATGGPAGSQQAPRWNPAATPVAESIWTQVMAEEQAERDLVDGAFVADAMLDQAEPAVEA